MKKFKILISAHEFSPFLGSECSVGWNLVMEIANYCNVVVLYAETNQFETQSYFEHVNKFKKENDIPSNITFFEVPQPNFAKFIIKINKLLSKDKISVGNPFLYFIAYNFWQKSAFKFVQKNINLNEIDLIHHITSISFREPGYLWKLNKPFVWGPISGNVKIPYGFFSQLSVKQIISQILRNLLITIQLKFSKRLKKVINLSKVIYCVTKEDLKYIESIKENNVYPMLDVGSRVVEKKETNNSNVFNFIWIGRIVYSKALDILINSISYIQQTHNDKIINFTIIGDGPELVNNVILSQRLSLNNISWLGYLPHEEVLKQLQNSHCLIHTSIREATSATILEALSYGVPVICHDAFGMGIAVDDSCGIKIPFIDTNTSIIEFGNAICRLIEDNKLFTQLSKNALIRAEQLSWKKMAIEITNHYDKILNN